MVIYLLMIKLASLCSLECISWKQRRGFSLLADCKVQTSQTKVWALETSSGSDSQQILLLCLWYEQVFPPLLATVINFQRDKHFMLHRVIITSQEERNLLRDSMNYAKIQICLKTRKHQQIESVYSFPFFVRPILLSLHTNHHHKLPNQSKFLNHRNKINSFSQKWLWDLHARYFCLLSF